MPSDSESCFLCPEIQGALTTAMMTGPWRVAILRATLDSLTSALEIWGQGSAFSSCTHSYTEPCRDRPPSRLKLAREGDGTAWRPSVQECPAIHSAPQLWPVCTHCHWGLHSCSSRFKPSFLKIFPSQERAGAWTENHHVFSSEFCM